MYDAHGVYFVTARTFQGRFLMKQMEETSRIAGGVLARAVRLSGVSLHAFVFTSNHLHAIVSARDGALSVFMRHLLGNLSKKLGPLAGWRGQFWERRFSAEPIFGADAQEGRLRYLLSHGVKEGLVRSPLEWPGLTCVRQLLSLATERFPFFHWSRRWKDGRLVKGGTNRFDARWIEHEELELQPLPAWAELSPNERRRRVKTMIDEIEAKWRQVHQEVRGVEATRWQRPGRRPKHVKRSPEPLCHADTRVAWVEYRRAYRRFAEWFREASARFLAGDQTAEFPPRAFKPFAWAAAAEPGAQSS